MRTSAQRLDSWLFLLIALGSGIVFDYLFYGKQVGISALLAVGCIYGLYLWSLGNGTLLKSRLGWAPLIPILLLSTSYALHDNGILRALNGVVIIGLILWHTQHLVYTAYQDQDQGQGQERHVFDIMKQALGGTLRHFLQPWRKIMQTLVLDKNGSASKQIRQIAVRVIGGCILGAPLVLIMIWLLSSADQAFGSIVQHVPQWLQHWKMEDWFWRVIGILLTGTYIFSYIWGMGIRSMNPEVKNESNGVRFTVDGIMTGTVLLLLNVVFLIFVSIQFTYLFGGSGTALPAGLTYAEYARSGFGELVVVTILNFSLMWFILRHLDRGGRIRVLWHKIHLLLMTMCSGVMLVSAVTRLTLYEQAYGFTVLRLIVYVTLLAMGLMFVIMLYHIWQDTKLSLIPYFMVGIVFYVGLNYVNIERIVAERNVDRYELTGQLDTNYLADLSYDVVEPLLQLRLDPMVGSEINDILHALRVRANVPTTWQSANWSRWRAKHLLNET